MIEMFSVACFIKSSLYSDASSLFHQQSVMSSFVRSSCIKNPTFRISNTAYTLRSSLQKCRVWNYSLIFLTQLAIFLTQLAIFLTQLATVTMWKTMDFPARLPNFLSRQFVQGFLLWGLKTHPT